MLALVAGLGALYALILAAAPVRYFFDLELLSAGQWFLCPALRRGRAGGRRASPGASPTSSGSRPGDRPGRGAAPGPHKPLTRSTVRQAEAPRADHRSRSARRAPSHQDRRHDRPGQHARRRRMAELIARRGRRLPAQLLPRHPRRARGERRDGPRGGASAPAREVGLLGDLPGPKLRLGELRATSSSSREGSQVTLTTGRGEDGRRTTTSRSPGTAFPGAVREGDEVYLADGAHPAARPARRRRRGHVRGRGRAAASPPTRG